MTRAIVIVLMLIALCACGGTSTPPSTPTPTLPYAEDLQRALVTISDLPPGWENQPDSSTHELNLLPCGEITPGVAYTEATALFQTDSGARLLETVAAFHSGDAEKWLTAGENGITCSQLNAGDNQGTPIVGQVTRPAYAPLGDQSFSLRLTIPGPTSTFVTDVIYVRIGDFIIQIGSTSVGGPDSELLTSLENAAVAKFHAAQF